MARALVIRGYFGGAEESEEIRQEVLRQYNAGGVITISKTYEIVEVEFDSVKAEELGECQPDLEQPQKIIYGNGLYDCPTCGIRGKAWEGYIKCPQCGQVLGQEV